MTRPADNAGQEDLFGGPQCLPASINVGPFGVAEDWLTSVLGTTAERLHAWHGDELGAPRDYSLRARGYFYTAAGIRRVLELLGKAGVVQVIERPAPPMPRRPAIAPGAQRPGGHAHHAAAAIEAREDRR